MTDEDIQSSVLEIAGTNVSTAYITCPADPAKTLGIKLPFLVMVIKNMNKYFSFEVQASTGCACWDGRGGLHACDGRERLGGRCHSCPLDSAVHL